MFSIKFMKVFVVVARVGGVCCVRCLPVSVCVRVHVNVELCVYVCIFVESYCNYTCSGNGYRLHVTICIVQLHLCYYLLRCIVLGAFLCYDFVMNAAGIITVGFSLSLWQSPAPFCPHRSSTTVTGGSPAPNSQTKKEEKSMGQRWVLPILQWWNPWARRRQLHILRERPRGRG